MSTESWTDPDIGAVHRQNLEESVGKGASPTKRLNRGDKINKSKLRFNGLKTKDLAQDLVK
jgi:hypothetical protein